jgi:hypothetical protein
MKRSAGSQLGRFASRPRTREKFFINSQAGAVL